MDGDILYNVNQKFSDEKANESLWHWEVQKQMQGLYFTLLVLVLVIFYILNKVLWLLVHIW